MVVVELVVVEFGGGWFSGGGRGWGLSDYGGVVEEDCSMNVHASFCTHFRQGLDHRI